MWIDLQEIQIKRITSRTKWFHNRLPSQPAKGSEKGGGVGMVGYGCGILKIERKKNSVDTGSLSKGNFLVLSTCIIT